MALKPGGSICASPPNPVCPRHFYKACNAKKASYILKGLHCKWLQKHQHNTLIFPVTEKNLLILALNYKEFAFLLF